MTIESTEPNRDAPLSGEKERERAALVDLLVPAAMLAVAVGAGVGSYLHLGLSAEFAAAIALTLFCLMLVGHVLVRASGPDGDAADPRQMVTSPMPSIPPAAKTRRAAANTPPSASVTPPPSPAPIAGKSRATAAETTDSRGPDRAVPTQPETAAISDELSASIEAARDAEVAAMRSFIARSIDDPSSSATVSAGVAGDAMAEPPRAEPRMNVEPAASASAPRLQVPTASQSEQDAGDLAAQSSDAWSYRPIDQRLPHVRQALADYQQSLGAVRPSPLEAPGNSPARAEAAIAEARRIDNILHRLATQIRSGQAANAAAALNAIEQADEISTTRTDGLVESAETGFPADDLANALGMQDAPAEGRAEHAQQAEQESALSDAVDALRATVETMRQPSTGGAAVSAPAARQSSSTGDGAMLRLAAVAEALAAERAQVFLEPILKLSDEEARHFEVSVHLVSPTGQLLDARAMAEGARGAGLLPLLDALGVRHSAGFALKLERRGRDGAVFSEVAGESLESESFVSDVADRHAQGIADRLVLTFAQSEVRGLGPAQFTALSGLRQLGFRFAMQNVADLDMDFEALAAVGFEFVKLDAAVFLDGLELAGIHIPASDLTRHFVELGLDVIVGRIDAETVRARVLACGAEFGQGSLFGAPRVIPTALPLAGGVAA